MIASDMRDPSFYHGFSTVYQCVMVVYLNAVVILKCPTLAAVSGDSVSVPESDSFAPMGFFPAGPADNRRALHRDRACIVYPARSGRTGSSTSAGRSDRKWPA